MKISTRGRYGLKAMVDIAIEGEGDKCVSLKSIAERQGLSENYLEQIISPLKKAGYLKSSRGAQGGYFLAKHPQSITVGDVLRVLEGNLAPVGCVCGEEDVACGSGSCGSCSTKSVWGRIYEGLSDIVDSITLSDIMEEHREPEKSE